MPGVAAGLAVMLSLGACAGGTPAPKDAGTRIDTRSAPESATGAPSGAPTRADQVRPARPRALTVHHETSRVVPVGVDSAQQLEIPGDIDTLGWWTGGAKPGSAKGFVVITGHATREGTGAANAWWSAKPGQKIRVRTPRGAVVYRVVSRKTYDKTDIPLARWFPPSGPHGPAGLALITCADYRDGEWLANTVVEAVPA
jgi:hypothetical protein